MFPPLLYQLCRRLIRLKTSRYRNKRNKQSCLMLEVKEKRGKWREKRRRQMRTERRRVVVKRGQPWHRNNHKLMFTPFS